MMRIEEITVKIQVPPLPFCWRCWKTSKGVILLNILLQNTTRVMWNTFEKLEELWTACCFHLSAFKGNYLYKRNDEALWIHVAVRMLQPCSLLTSVFQQCLALSYQTETCCLSMPTQSWHGFQLRCCSPVPRGRAGAGCAGCAITRGAR